MAITVNSFLFGSLLTSTKVTALQDSWIQVQSSFIADHFYNGTTLVTSHRDVVVHNYPGDVAEQAVVSAKRFNKQTVFDKDVSVGSFQTVTGPDGHIRLQASAPALDGAIGRNSNIDQDGVFLMENMAGIDNQEDNTKNSYAFGIEGGSFLSFSKRDAGAGATAWTRLFKVSNTGVVSTVHVPSAGRAFGGTGKSGNVTVSASIEWGSVGGVTDGVLNCMNFTLDPQITITNSRTHFGSAGKDVYIFAVGSITINGAIVAIGETKANVGAVNAGNPGRFGGTGGGGGGADGTGVAGAEGGTTTAGNSGGAGGGTTAVGNNGSPGNNFNAYFMPNVVKKISPSGTELPLSGAYGAEGGGGGEVNPLDSGHGGGGGGLIYLEAPLITFSNVSTLQVTGGAGGAAVGNGGGGGGGGGGLIYMKAVTITDNGRTEDLSGGVGGAAAGGGAAGGVGGIGKTVTETVL